MAARQHVLTSGLQVVHVEFTLPSHRQALPAQKINAFFAKENFTIADAIPLPGRRCRAPWSDGM